MTEFSEREVKNAYDSGADARCEEFGLDDNPYSVDTPMWKAWNQGWAEHPHKGETWPGGTPADGRTRE